MGYSLNPWARGPCVLEHQHTQALKLYNARHLKGCKQSILQCMCTLIVSVAFMWHLHTHIHTIAVLWAEQWHPKGLLVPMQHVSHTFHAHADVWLTQCNLCLHMCSDLQVFLECVTLAHTHTTLAHTQRILHDMCTHPSTKAAIESNYDTTIGCSQELLTCSDLRVSIMWGYCAPPCAHTQNSACHMCTHPFAIATFDRNNGTTIGC